jgi:gas vesicle protein
MAKSGTTILALLTGAAIGAGVGILYAPDKGDKTRKKIQKDVKKAKADIDAKVRQTYADLNTKANTFRGSLEDRLETTLSSASYKADDVIQALENKLEQLREKNSKLQKPTSQPGNEAEKKISV